MIPDPVAADSRGYKRIPSFSICHLTVFIDHLLPTLFASTEIASSSLTMTNEKFEMENGK